MNLNDLLEQNNRTAAAWAQMEKHISVLQQVMEITGVDACDYCAHRDKYTDDGYLCILSTVCPRCNHFSLWERE